MLRAIEHERCLPLLSRRADGDHVEPAVAQEQCRAPRESFGRCRVQNFDFDAGPGRCLCIERRLGLGIGSGVSARARSESNRSSRRLRQIRREGSTSRSSPKAIPEGDCFREDVVAFAYRPVEAKANDLAEDLIE